MQQRITELLHSGWTRVKVVTDHGWLMAPGGLPKIELPKHLESPPAGAAGRYPRGFYAQHGIARDPHGFGDSAEAVVLAPAYRG